MNSAMVGSAACRATACGIATDVNSEITPAPSTASRYCAPSRYSVSFSSRSTPIRMRMFASRRPHAVTKIKSLACSTVGSRYSGLPRLASSSTSLAREKSRRE